MIDPSVAAGRAYQRVRSVVLEAVVVLAGVVTYFGIRGVTATDPESAVDHAHDVLALERTLGLDLEWWVQDLVLPYDAVSTAFNWVYIWGHWPVIVATLLWLALRHRTAYLRLRNAMMISGGLGLLVYTTYPVAPPRLADLGLVDTVTERSHSYRVLQPPAFVNQYAAMPSLHVGWDLLVGLVVLSVATTLWLRTLARLMPVLMAVATVATANHYLLDALAGAAFALTGLAGALVIERRRARAEADDLGAPAEQGAPPGAATSAGPVGEAGSPAAVPVDVPRAGPSAPPVPRPRPPGDGACSPAGPAGERLPCGRGGAGGR